MRSIFDVRRVCRRWNSIASDSTLLHRCTFLDESQGLDDGRVSQVVPFLLKCMCESYFGGLPSVWAFPNASWRGLPSVSPAPELLSITVRVRGRVPRWQAPPGARKWLERYAISPRFYDTLGDFADAIQPKLQAAQFRQLRPPRGQMVPIGRVLQMPCAKNVQSRVLVRPGQDTYLSRELLHFPKLTTPHRSVVRNNPNTTKFSCARSCPRSAEPYQPSVLNDCAVCQG